MASAKNTEGKDGAQNGGKDSVRKRAPPKVVADDAALKALISTQQRLLVKFTASWCKPCKAIEPHFLAELDSHPSVSAAIVHDADTAAADDILDAYQVLSYPTFIAFYGGQRLQEFTVPGANPQRLSAAITALANHRPKPTRT
jgi:thioredoxin 1